jgi:predicted dehydrogenase
MKKTLRLGLIGSGFMGKTHVFGFAAARAGLGFRRATDDWRSLVADPEIDIAAEASVRTFRELTQEVVPANKIDTGGY